MSTLAKKLNASLNLTGKLAVLTGGSQGIGGAAAVRFAQAGSSVIVVGRNEKLLSEVVDRCKKVAKDGPSGKTFAYIKADLSLVPGINAAIRDITEKSNGSVDYLVQTQGGPPNGTWQDHFGMEFHFAVQVLSRYAINERLASSGVLKEASVNVCAPGGSQTTFDLDDIECRSYRNKNFLSLAMAIGSSQGLITDTYTKALQSKYPQINFFHLFPGIVTTNASSNRGFPFPIPQLFSLASPVISRTIGNSPESYAEIPVMLSANGSSEAKAVIEREGHALNQSLKGVKTAPWANNTENQTRTLEKLESFMHTTPPS